MFERLKKLFKKNKSSELQKKAKAERNRLYMENREATKAFKKRKRICIKPPEWMRNKSFQSHMKMLYIVLLILAMVGTLFIIYGPYFKIKTIEIVRKDDITDINIAYKSLEDYRNHLIFSVGTKEIAEQLKLYQKNISEVSIKEVFPDTLDITVGSYKGIFSTVINGKNYILTSNGVLVPGKGGSDLQVLKFTPQYATLDGVIDYKQVFSPKYIGKAIDLLTIIRNNFLSAQVKAMYYFPKEREVHVDVNNTKLIFDIDGDIDEQLKRMVVFTKEKVALDKLGAIYIDLRVKNKIFFCTYDTEFDCRANLSYFYQYQ